MTNICNLSILCPECLQSVLNCICASISMCATHNKEYDEDSEEQDENGDEQDDMQSDVSQDGDDDNLQLSHAGESAMRTDGTSRRVVGDEEDSNNML